MTTIQALLVGGIGGFLLGSICWLILGLTLGLLQESIGEALNKKLEIDNQETNNNGS